MNQEPSDLSAIEKRATRAGRRSMLLWAILSTAVYWISGHEFERSPELGWLLIVIIGGAVPVGILSKVSVQIHMQKYLER